MRIEAIVVGDELLNGDLADTNTARLGKLLRGLGLGFARGQSVPDDPASIVDALGLAAGRAELVLVTGGLGPTEDDLTIASAARFAGVPLVEDAPSLARIRRHYERRGFAFGPRNARQAMIPERALALDNHAGTAPGVRMTVGTTTFFFFPGVPREVDRLAADHLIPWLGEHAPVRPARSRTFKTFGRTESEVAALLDPLPRSERLHVAYRAHFPEIQVTLHVRDEDATRGEALLDELAARARELLGSILYAERSEDTLASVVAALLLERPCTLALAESCTGGLVAAMLTEVPGVSSVFVESAVTYANEAKVRRLGVPESVLAEHGAVSKETARAMAEGARQAAGTDMAVALTGIAGPGGGTEAKPVGTVHVALNDEHGTWHRVLHLPFDRRRNRIVSAWVALDMVRRRLLDLGA